MKKVALLIVFAMLLVFPLGAFFGCGRSRSDETDGQDCSDDGSLPETGTSAPESAPESVPDEGADEPEADSLCGAFEGEFYVGVALPGSVTGNFSKYEDVVTANFNSMTCENEMKPDALLDRAANAADPEKYYTEPKVNFASAKAAADFAVKHGMKLRLHTLVWHSQTPAWLFTEDYTDGGALVSREVMLSRMESYIKTVLGYFEENYPGLVYAVDVVNEAFDVGDGDADGIRMKNNKWYDTVGPDYVYQAFLFARRYAGEGMRLFYNDYACMWKPDLILKHLSRIKDEGLIDGIGMQSHLAVGDPLPQFISTAQKFCQAGYEVQLTELDVGVKSEADFEAQGKFYGELIKGILRLRESGCDITSVTVWGLSDALTWRAGEFPLLFNGDLTPKPAYDAFLAAAG